MTDELLYQDLELIDQVTKLKGKTLDLTEDSERRQEAGERWKKEHRPSVMAGSSGEEEKGTGG